MSPAVRLAHYVRTRPASRWNEESVREMALAALSERDALAKELGKLKRTSLGPKFQGMTELA